jgi:hypothetical protein
MPRSRASRADLDVYLLPAVVGSGWGDLAEVHAAGQWLSKAGFPVQIYRPPEHRWPRGLPGPFDWPRQVSRARGGAPRALTISSQFGVTCAPGRDEPLGRAGPWAPEVAALEAAYGADAVLHVSLEEFARTLTSREQVDEREREGGVPSRVRAGRRGTLGRRSQEREAHELYRKFRAFDRPNLLTVFPTFSPRTAFHREFPEAVQTGPVPPYGVGRARRRPHRGKHLLWYASPSTSDRLLRGIRSALAGSMLGVSLTVRSPRELPIPPIPGVRLLDPGPSGPSDWDRIWSGTDLVIASGSRTLLEAIVRGVPFLYFNGVAGRGARTRRHRPEKLDALLRRGSGRRCPPGLRRDLLDFARARRVAEIVRDRLHRPQANAPFLLSSGFPADRSNGAEFLLRVAREFAGDPDRGAREQAERWRAAAGR